MNSTTTDLQQQLHDLEERRFQIEVCGDAGNEEHMRVIEQLAALEASLPAELTGWYREFRDKVDTVIQAEKQSIEEEIRREEAHRPRPPGGGM